MLLLSFIVIGFLPVTGQTTKCLVLDPTDPDVNPMYIELSVVPVITFQDNYMTISFPIYRDEYYAFSSYRGYHFEDFDPTGIQLPEDKAESLNLDIAEKDRIKIKNLPSGSIVKVTDMSGRVVMTKKHDGGTGEVVIQKSDLPVGTYIINVGLDKSFKFIKK